RNLYVLPYSSGNIAHKGLAQEVFYRLYGRPLGLEQAEESVLMNILKPLLFSPEKMPVEPATSTSVFEAITDIIKSLGSSAQSLGASALKKVQNIPLPDLQDKATKLAKILSPFGIGALGAWLDRYFGNLDYGEPQAVSKGGVGSSQSSSSGQPKLPEGRISDLEQLIAKSKETFKGRLPQAPGFGADLPGSKHIDIVPFLMPWAAKNAAETTIPLESLSGALTSEQAFMLYVIVSINNINRYIYQEKERGLSESYLNAFTANLKETATKLGLAKVPGLDNYIARLVKVVKEINAYYKLYYPNIVFSSSLENLYKAVNDLKRSLGTLYTELKVSELNSESAPEIIKDLETQLQALIKHHYNIMSNVWKQFISNQTEVYVRNELHRLEERERKHFSSLGERTKFYNGIAKSLHDFSVEYIGDQDQTYFNIVNIFTTLVKIALTVYNTTREDELSAVSDKLDLLQKELQKVVKRFEPQFEKQFGQGVQNIFDATASRLRSQIQRKLEVLGELSEGAESGEASSQGGLERSLEYWTAIREPDLSKIGTSTATPEILGSSLGFQEIGTEGQSLPQAVEVPKDIGLGVHVKEEGQVPSSAYGHTQTETSGEQSSFEGSESLSDSVLGWQKLSDLVGSSTGAGTPIEPVQTQATSSVEVAKPELPAYLQAIFDQMQSGSYFAHAPKDISPEDYFSDLAKTLETILSGLKAEGLRNFEGDSELYKQLYAEQRIFIERVIRGFEDKIRIKFGFLTQEITDAFDLVRNIMALGVSFYEKYHGLDISRKMDQLFQDGMKTIEEAKGKDPKTNEVLYAGIAPETFQLLSSGIWIVPLLAIRKAMHEIDTKIIEFCTGKSDSACRALEALINQLIKDSEAIEWTIKDKEEHYKLMLAKKLKDVVGGIGI
ncbi:MAG TPA: hypothetical protein VHA52_08210, partial [Candidatus Babeliaceae bacterium]|nr:hypothetical protein [Candidatus Babeliaceae bacterium]